MAAFLVPSISHAQPADPSACAKVTTHNQLLRRVLRFSHRDGDFRASSPSRAQFDRLGSMRACQKHTDRAKYRLARGAWNQVRDAWAWHRRIDQATPYGKWAIPPYIVACESGGAWGAYNPSGASGPYQLLGWGAPMPASTPARKAQHHLIAARLWNGGRGASHWVCA